MCYSAMVLSDIRKTARTYGATPDLESFHDLFALRSQHPEIKIPVGLEDYFLRHGDSKAEESIKNFIKTFRKTQDASRKLELEDLQAEIAELELRLRTKVTKTHQAKLEVKLRKREKLLRRGAAGEKEAIAYRIYPYFFAPVVVVDHGKKLVRPMRYRILPSSGVEIPPQYNVFNARRDSLLEARTWKATFGKKHALFPFLNFYEWVKDAKGNKVELTFSPDGYDQMWAASLYENCDKKYDGLIQSFAMVTDDPPPEVAAAGHDRCPVFLDHSCIEAWLHPEKASLKELDQLLERKSPTYFSHRSAA